MQYPLAPHHFFEKKWWGLSLYKKFASNTLRIYNVYMIKNNFYSFAGIFVFLIPFLGIPVKWRNYILSIFGLIIFVYSIWPIISKSISKRFFLKSKLND